MPVVRLRRVLLAASALLLVLTFAGTGCSGDAEGKARAAAETFLAALAKGDVPAAARATDDPATAQRFLTRTVRTLRPRSATLAVRDVDNHEGSATVRFHAAWSLAGLTPPWRYDGRLAMMRRSQRWTVHWQPADIHPRLGNGQRLGVERTLADRAAILDSRGRPIARTVGAVTVGVQPSLVTDLPALAATLARVLQVTPTKLTADVRAAEPTEFVPVTTIPRERYLAVKPHIHDLPGTVFRESSTVVGPAPHYAQPLLGTVGEPTAELLRSLGPAYLPSDQLGLSGLQRAFNTQLAGTPTVRIVVLDSQNDEVAQVARFAGRAGAPLRTTLDLRAQSAAEHALTGVSQQSAIIAVQPSTGSIRAVATSAGVLYNIAFLGHYPPGSTFKIVTAAAALQNGAVGPDTPVDCPSAITIGGRTIPNENRFQRGTIPFRLAFAHSCNTTFAALSQRLTNQALPQAAAQFGVAAGWDLQVGTFSGSIPPADGAVERAEDAFGQGKVLVSPLAEALIAATVARGSTPTPVIIDGRRATAARPPTSPPAATVGILRELMRSVVTDGTATVLRAAPGGPVSGKTGTAEHGATRPMPAHSWFAGYQGDLAFAVFVQDGQTSGRPAPPVALRFLTALHAS